MRVFCVFTRDCKKLWCGREDSNLHGIATASPSSWCVCQFRHYRTVVWKPLYPGVEQVATTPDPAIVSSAEMRVVLPERFAPAGSEPESCLIAARSIWAS